jgi:hypothetical protein
VFDNDAHGSTAWFLIRRRRRFSKIEQFLLVEYWDALGGFMSIIGKKTLGRGGRICTEEGICGGGGGLIIGD